MHRGMITAMSELCLRSSVKDLVAFSCVAAHCNHIASPSLVYNVETWWSPWKENHRSKSEMCKNIAIHIFRWLYTNKNIMYIVFLVLNLTHWTIKLVPMLHWHLEFNCWHMGWLYYEAVTGSCLFVPGVSTNQGQGCRHGRLFSAFKNTAVCNIDHIDSRKIKINYIFVTGTF